jgi:Asp-tRNA(Asn)/Glu-tRNA(Gln) amidotransferase A subunit family amidase
VRPYLEELGRAPGPLRIAYHTTDYAGVPLSADAIAAIEATASLLRDLGHEVEEACPEVDMAALVSAMGVVIAGNLYQGVMARYKELDRHSDGIGVEHVTWDMVRAAERLSAADYAGAVTAFHMAGRSLGRFFEGHDLVMSATMRNPPGPLGSVKTGEWDMEELFEAAKEEMPITPLFNQTGCPAMSVPLHWTADNLPIGVHFGAAYGREDRLFRLAAQLEEAQPWFDRVPEL